MRRGWQAVFIAMVSVTFVPRLLADDTTPTPGKTGEFTVKFTTRSPLSNPKELGARLGAKKLDPDYDLSSEEFMVHVSPNYDETKPPGLIVILNYKDSGDLPMPVLATLDEKNLALVVPKRSSQEYWVKCGLALDAVHNMQQLYKIDPKRIYVFGFDKNFAGLRCAVNYPDVFNGSFNCLAMAFWKPMRASSGGIYNPELPPPPAKQLGVAKSHPIIFSTYQIEEHEELVLKNYKADGFKNAKLQQVTQDDVHYPNYKTPWLIDAVTYLDTNLPKAKPPATKPAAATKPAK